MKTFFALLLVALVSFETTKATTYEAIDVYQAQRGLFDDLMKQCQELIESLKNTVMNAVNKAINQISGLKDQLKNMVDSAIDAAKKEFQGIIDKALGEIQVWKTKAEQLGIEVKDCYLKSEEDIKNLPQKFLDLEIDCVMNEYNNGLKIITDSQKIIDDLIKKFNAMNLSEKLSGCMNAGWGAISCVYNVIAEVTGLATSLPAEISKKVQEVVIFVQGVPVRLQACTLTQVIAMQQEVTGIVSKVIDCIKGKLGMSYLLLD